MSSPEIVFDGVWKKFTRGERFNSLRDLVPAMVSSLWRSRPDAELHEREFWALRDVSFRVRAGEALGIIGPNGAGKSTALKVLTRILRPDRGASAVRGRVGALVEIAAGFHPDLTGRENVLMQGAILGMKRAEILARFDEIVEFAGVGEFIDTPVKRYSSGMNARLGFAVAVHVDPEVLIIDEVLSVGDLTFQEKCLERMQRFVRSGIAVVFVSHNLSAVSMLCTQVLVLRQGRVEALADTQEAIATYSRIAQASQVREASHQEVLVSLVDSSGCSVSDVSAGQRLTAIARARPAQGTSFYSELRLRHLESGAQVFSCRSHAVGADPVTPGPDGAIEAEWSFLANLGRGHYTVSVNVLNEEHRWVASSAPILLTVNERQSSRAIVFLNPVCTMRALPSRGADEELAAQSVASPSAKS